MMKCYAMRGLGRAQNSVPPRSSDETLSGNLMNETRDDASNGNTAAHHCRCFRPTHYAHATIERRPTW